MTAIADPLLFHWVKAPKSLLPIYQDINTKWSPGNTLNDSTIYNPVAKPILNTTYTLTVTTPDNCSQTTSVNITVIRLIVLCPIYSWNAFTPNNGDGKMICIILGQIIILVCH